MDGGDQLAAEGPVRKLDGGPRLHERAGAFADDLHPGDRRVVLGPDRDLRDRDAVRRRLASCREVDDVSLSGTRLQVRGAAGVGDELVEIVRRCVGGLVAPEDVVPRPPSLEDVFILKSEEVAKAA